MAALAAWRLRRRPTPPSDSRASRQRPPTRTPGPTATSTSTSASPPPADDVKDLTIGLPPGLVGDPTATPLCTLAQLQGDSCPSASQVGTVTANATAHLLDPLPLNLPLTVDRLALQRDARGRPAGALRDRAEADRVRPAPAVAEDHPGVGRAAAKERLRAQHRPRRTSPTWRTPPAGRSAFPSISTRSTSTSTGPWAARGSCVTRRPAGPRRPDSSPTPTRTRTRRSPGRRLTRRRTAPRCRSRRCSRPGWGRPAARRLSRSPPLTTQITQGPGEAGLKNAQVLLPSGSQCRHRPLNNPCPLPSSGPTPRPARLVDRRLGAARPRRS